MSIPIATGWLESTQELHERFTNAKPFPHVVLDDFLDSELADALLDSFPSIDDMPRSRDFIFADKHELSSIEASGVAGERFHETMTSPSFASFVGAVSGESLFVDPTFHGGGFHQGADGSYLDLHVDFNLHPVHHDWLRRLNILLYLNKDWRDEYGGHLLMKARTDLEPVAVAPVFNRCVIALTDDFTYHGYRAMHLPPGVTRKSIATYAYRRVEVGHVTPRTTGWAPESARPIKRFVAANYNWLVQRKNRWFGSGTSRNR